MSQSKVVHFHYIEFGIEPKIQTFLGQKRLTLYMLHKLCSIMYAKYIMKHTIYDIVDIFWHIKHA